jgi:hypothetical protein
VSGCARYSFAVELTAPGGVWDSVRIGMTGALGERTWSSALCQTPARQAGRGVCCALNRIK